MNVLFNKRLFSLSFGLAITARARQSKKNTNPTCKIAEGTRNINFKRLNLSNVNYSTIGKRLLVDIIFSRENYYIENGSSK